MTVKLETERIDPRYADLDAWASEDALAAMLEAQMMAVAAIRPRLAALAAAVDAAAVRIGQQGVSGKGRLVYVGAGTSGRIGVQDGSELPPTFRWPHERLAFLMAGGQAALTRAIEGAEDDKTDGRQQVDALQISPADVVIATAASGTTPFTIAAVTRARRRGALTIAIASNPGAPLLSAAEHPLLIETGAEVIAGSTRMKAGTAHKVVLNLLSTGIMVRLGRVHGGIMVEMKPTNAKLERRAVAIVEHLAGCAPAVAQRALKTAEGDIKTAVLIAEGASKAKASAALSSAKGNLRLAKRARAGRRLAPR